LPRRLDFLLGLLATSATAWAYPHDYGPFGPGREPKRFKLHDCSEPEARVMDARDNPVRYTFGTNKDSNRQPRIRLDWDGNCWNLSVLDATGQTPSEPRAVSDFYAVNQCRCADLNRDGRPDFVISMWSSGCGLGAEHYTVVFAISSGNTYRITTTTTFDPGPEDFIDIDGDGQCEIIHSAFVQNDARNEPDGKPHNYWVYHLLKMRDGNLEVANDDVRFPRWIWYRVKPNHSPERRLPPDLTKRLWEEQGDVFWKPPQRTPAPHPAMTE
jgi:hypothetical protein